MTVYEFFKNQAKLNRTRAQKVILPILAKPFVRDAEKWDRRAGMLTPEVGGQLVDDVILWRVIEEVDARIAASLLKGV